jgi:hypothetical protein
MDKISVDQYHVGRKEMTTGISVAVAMSRILL